VPGTITPIPNTGLLVHHSPQGSSLNVVLLDCQLHFSHIFIAVKTLQMKYIALSVLCSLLTFFACAQKDYKKAVIHTKTGDSLRCLLKDREWLENPTSITIRTIPANITQEVNIGDISRIIIENGDYYQSANVKIDQTPSEFQTPYLDPLLIKFEQAQVLLQVEYAASPFTLLSLRRRGRFYLYIQKNDEEPRALIYRKVLLVRDGVSFETEDNTFISQLAELLAGCAKAVKKTDNASYSTANIISVLKVYNEECGGKTAQFSNEKRLTGTMGFYLIGGMLVNNPVFAGRNGFTGSPFITSNHLKTEPTFSGGIRLQYLLPRAHQRMAVLLDLLYNSYSSTVTEIKNFTSNDLYTRETLTLQPALIKTAFMARYYLADGAFRPFLQAGFAGGLTISHEESVVLDDYYAGQSHISVTNPYNGISYKKTHMGFTGGGGVAYKRISADYRYEHITGSVNIINMRSSVTSHSVLIGFRINR
jgi:opacity protein-like surface antigen